ncbi:hypothetical protein FB446DRAFT_758114 [Lentinula raphanica]|nr:hypothetical protein FB446DRAFT_758114 [Lentinula raphanica]
MSSNFEREEQSGEHHVDQPDPTSKMELTHKGRFPFSYKYHEAPLAGTLVGEHKAPFYYLGWLIPWEEKEQLLGEVAQGYDPINYYHVRVLPHRWAEVGGEPSQPCPDVKLYEHSLKLGLYEAQLLVYIVINHPLEMHTLQKYGETFIKKAMETIGLPEDKRKDLKWYYVRD